MQDALDVEGFVKCAVKPREKELLIKKKLVPELMLEGVFEEKPYIILEKLEGSVQIFSSEKYHGVLNSFKKKGCTNYQSTLDSKYTR